MKWAERRRKRVEKAVAHYELELSSRLAHFREAAGTCSAEAVAACLPDEIYLIKDTQAKLRMLKRRLAFLRLFSEEEAEEPFA